MNDQLPPPETSQAEALFAWGVMIAGTAGAVVLVLWWLWSMTP